jgi:hypothetical protein
MVALQFSALAGNGTAVSTKSESAWVVAKPDGNARMSIHIFSGVYQPAVCQAHHTIWGHL